MNDMLQVFIDKEMADKRSSKKNNDNTSRKEKKASSL